MGAWREALPRSAAALACALAVGACSDNDDATPTPVKPARTASPAFTFAPLVQHHLRELDFPIGADRFIERATLKWKDERCYTLESVATGTLADRKTVEGVPRVRAARLAGSPRPYRRRALDRDCKRPTGPRFSTVERTAPFDDHADRAALPAGTGFYLDVLTDSYDGDARFARRGEQRVLAGVPAYYELSPVEVDGRPGARIVYWLLYARNQGVEVDGIAADAHEGDWESLEVVARRASRRGWWLPVSLRLRPGNRPLPWRELARAGSHPLLFSARGTHRLSAGEGRVGACPDCAQWRTWRSLERLAEQPWYGFGGGWGLAWRALATSGPVGPMP